MSARLTPPVGRRPGLKIRWPSAAWSTGMWEWPKTTRSASGNRRRSRAARPRQRPESLHHRQAHAAEIGLEGVRGTPGRRRPGRRCCPHRPAPARMPPARRAVRAHIPACGTQVRAAQMVKPPAAGRCASGGARAYPPALPPFTALSLRHPAPGVPWPCPPERRLTARGAGQTRAVGSAPGGRDRRLLPRDRARRGRHLEGDAGDPPSARPWSRLATPTTPHGSYTARNDRDQRCLSGVHGAAEHAWRYLGVGIVHACGQECDGPPPGSQTAS